MYESPTWINEIKPVNDGMIIREKIQVTRLLATLKSVIRLQRAGAAPAGLSRIPGYN